ncbi:MAG TPA: hypothetical protein VM577_03755 [Anaerovoracaceae bacterium]|nr:hypothetical protein [Anaerovoracaceae bacterium]
MDPVLKLWLYESWSKDLEEANEFTRSYTVLGGYFSNPELARKMVKQENPDFESSDEDFDKASKKMVEDNRKELKSRRRRKQLIKEMANPPKR